MRVRVTWRGVPKEHRDVFAPYVRRYLRSLPCWVQAFTVEYNNDPPADAGTTLCLEVSAQEEMREATLFYRPTWLEFGEAERDELVSHEFAHIHWLPVCGLVEAVLRDANAPRALREQFDARVEAATQDAAVVLRAAYGGVTL
jgi:hypothetical protein